MEKQHRNHDPVFTILCFVDSISIYVSLAIFLDNIYMFFFVVDCVAVHLERVSGLREHFLAFPRWTPSGKAGLKQLRLCSYCLCIKTKQTVDLGTC